MKKKEEPKSTNIVQKVFGRQDKGGGPVSTLFTYTKQAPKVLAEPPAFSSLPAAIDLGTSSLKLLQLAKDPKGQVEVCLLDEEPYENASGRDLWQKQKDALQKALLRNRIGNAAVITLSAKEAQVHNFVFPEMPEKELEEAVHWKIRQARPFDLDIEKVRYGLVRWTTRPSASGVSTQQRVTVVCAPEEAVAKRVDLLNQMGLKTLSVEAAPVSLMNLKRHRSAMASPDETALWLDLGADESTIVVERAGTALFFRNLTITARQLTRQLAQFLRVDELKAEELKRRHGLVYWSPEKDASGALQEEKVQKSDEEAAVVYNGLVSLLENLVIDIEHSFKYFSYQVTQSQINKFDRVVLTGGGAHLRNLDGFLSARLSVPVDRWEPLAGLRTAERLQGEKGALLSGPLLSFSVSMGLSLGQLLPKHARMNLLAVHRPVSLGTVWKKARKSPTQALAAAACVLLVLLGPPIVRTAHYKALFDDAEREFKDTKLALGRLQASELKTAEEETKLLEKKQLLQTKLRVLRESSQGDRPFSEVLAKLSELLPEEVWITKLSYNQEKMTLVGLTLNNELIVNFMDELNRSKGFRDVAFNYTQRETNAKTYRFEVTMKVR